MQTTLSKSSTFSRAAVARPSRHNICAKATDPLREASERTRSAARDVGEKARSATRDLGYKASSTSRDWREKASSATGGLQERASYAGKQLSEQARDAARYSRKTAESTVAPRGSIFNQGKPPSQADDPNYQVSVGEFLHTGDEPEPTFGEVMRFDGTAPEIINGRLAMLGFVAAAAAELWTGQGIFQQWQTRPAWVLGAFAVFIGASLYPFLVGKKVQKVGPLANFLNPTAEIINGRTAMVAFASMLAIEWFKGSAFFGHIFHR